MRRNLSERLHLHPCNYQRIMTLTAYYARYRLFQHYMQTTKVQKMKTLAYSILAVNNTTIGFPSAIARMPER